MKYLMWLLKAAIFFNPVRVRVEQPAGCNGALLLRHPMARAVGAGGVDRFRPGSGCGRPGHGAALVAPAHSRAQGHPGATRRRRHRHSPNRPPWTLTSAGSCWACPFAFVLGWLASRLDLRQLRIENRQAPKAYFKGLNYLLNEQQDQAIDAFIEAVQNDPDTSELHFALGNLFRRRGEYERAVRVHEHLLSRGDLSRADRDRAQHALALDFLKAGLLDRGGRSPAQTGNDRVRGRRHAWRFWPSTNVHATGRRPPRRPASWRPAAKARSPHALPTICASRRRRPVTRRPSPCCARP